MTQGRTLSESAIESQLRRLGHHDLEHRGRGRWKLTIGDTRAIEVDLREPPNEAMRENLACLPEFELVGERTVSTLAEDMDLGFRRIAYLGFADRPGILRY